MVIEPRGLLFGAWESINNNILVMLAIRLLHRMIEYLVGQLVTHQFTRLKGSNHRWISALAQHLTRREPLPPLAYCQHLPLHTLTGTSWAKQKNHLCLLVIMWL